MPIFYVVPICCCKKEILNNWNVIISKNLGKQTRHGHTLSKLTVPGSFPVASSQHCYTHCSASSITQQRTLSWFETANEASRLPRCEVESGRQCEERDGNARFDRGRSGVIGRSAGSTDTTHYVDLPTPFFVCLVLAGLECCRALECCRRRLEWLVCEGASVRLAVPLEVPYRDSFLKLLKFSKDCWIKCEKKKKDKHLKTVPPFMKPLARKTNYVNIQYV